MDMNTIVRSDFIVIALFLSILGMILKYRTPLENKLIPLVLLAVGVLISIIWGWFTSSFIGGARWVDAILYCGIIHGMIVTAIAAYGWDSIYGWYKVGLTRKATTNKKQGEQK